MIRAICGKLLLQKWDLFSNIHFLEEYETQINSVWQHFFNIASVALFQYIQYDKVLHKSHIRGQKMTHFGVTIWQL